MTHSRSQPDTRPATCPECAGIGSVCLACDQPIDDCECFENSEPSLCFKCMGRGTILFDDEDKL